MTDGVGACWNGLGHFMGGYVIVRFFLVELWMFPSSWTAGLMLCRTMYNMVDPTPQCIAVPPPQARLRITIWIRSRTNLDRLNLPILHQKRSNPPSTDPTGPTCLPLAIFCIISTPPKGSSHSTSPCSASPIPKLLKGQPTLGIQAADLFPTIYWPKNPQK
jgi:hypothetical protein